MTPLGNFLSPIMPSTVKHPSKMSSSAIVGVLGGGQLGRMLCQAAAPLGIPVAILDAEGSPAKQVNASALNVTGSFKDPVKIRELASRCDILTVETEHVDTATLEDIGTNGVKVRGPDGRETVKRVAVHPGWRTLRLIQDKYAQKEHFRNQGVPVAEQIDVDSGAIRALQEVSNKFGYPWVLKSKKDSYDGRGNMEIADESDFPTAVEEFGHLDCYAEKWVPFVAELSVLVIRAEDDWGNMKELIPYPVVETVHEDNVCSRVYLPPRDVPDSMCKKAQSIACEVVKSLEGRGVFAVEMFFTESMEILVNEVAPRTHNSGHLFTEAIPSL